jgi:TolA-binding protein
VTSACRLVIVALALTGCGVVAKPSADVDAPARTNAAEQPPRAAEPPARAAEQQRLELTRVAGELAELQNAVAKLIVASRQQEDQLTFLRRRLE